MKLPLKSATMKPENHMDNKDDIKRVFQWRITQDFKIMYVYTSNQDINEIPFGKCWRSDYSGVPGVYHYEHLFNVNQAQ